MTRWPSLCAEFQVHLLRSTVGRLEDTALPGEEAENGVAGGHSVRRRWDADVFAERRTSTAILTPAPLVVVHERTISAPSSVVLIDQALGRGVS